MVSRVDPILGMPLGADDGDDIAFSQIDTGSNPYLHYGQEGEERVEKVDKKKKGKDRPRSAARRDEESKSGRK